MDSETLLRLALWVAQAGGGADSPMVIEALKIIVPVVIAISGSYFLSRRQHTSARLAMEVQNQRQLAGERDKLIGGWQLLTDQARETVTRAYAEAAEAVAARKIAEARTATLEVEMKALRASYDLMLRELDELRRKGSRRS